MKLPIIPLFVATVLMGGAVFLLNRARVPEPLVMGAPDLEEFLDVEGVESEIAVSPDGRVHAVIASGDLWIYSESDGLRRMTSTPEPESSPWWEGNDTVLFTRGSDTFRTQLPGSDETLHRQNAISLVKSADGREAFVRERSIWIASTVDDEGEVVVGAEDTPEITFRSIRFSPDGQHLAMIRTAGGRRGRLDSVDLASGIVRTIVGDRVAENPSGLSWIDDRRLAYVTDRSGGIAVWYIDLDENVMVPLTPPMMERSLAVVGLDVVIDAAGERILLPVHRFDSDITTLDGRVLASGEAIESEPALSPLGDRVAFTVQSEGVSQIWTVPIEGGEAEHLTLGRHPRFAPNGLELVFARTDLDGNRDIWKADIRTGVPSRLTDDPAVDDTPDWSPDGRTIVFFSEADGRGRIWTMPATGGQRVPWVEAGHWPRYSPDGSRVAFWTPEGFVISDASGNRTALVPAPTSAGPPIWISGEVHGVDDMRLPEVFAETGREPLIGPVLDQGPDGTWVVETIRIESTAIWRLDLQYTEVE